MASITGTFKAESSRVRESNDWYLKFHSRARGVWRGATRSANLRVRTERVIYRRRLRGKRRSRFQGENCSDKLALRCELLRERLTAGGLERRAACIRAQLPRGRANRFSHASR